MSDALGQSLEYGFTTRLLGLMPGALVIDVGAEKGSVIALALAAGVRKIHAFEPFPPHFETLSRQWPAEARVSLHRQAISNHSGTATFHIATGQDGRALDHHHSLAEVTGSKSFSFSTSVEVEALTLAEAVDRHGIDHGIDLLKIDTEGHDLAVLGGLGNLRPRAIVCEFWHDLPETSGRCPYLLGDLAAAAHELGYQNLLTFSHLDGISWIDINTSATRSPRQWGNVFFLRDDLWLKAVAGPLADTLAELNRANLEVRQRDARDLLAKETVINELATVAKERLILINQLDAALTASKGT